MTSRTITGIMAAATIVVASQMALGSYTSIQHNLQWDGTSDTAYQNGILSINQASNDLTLTIDGAVQSGTVTEASVAMYTNFDYFQAGYRPEHPYGTAFFTGGEFKLQFKWNGSPDFYELSGPIAGMQVGVTSYSDIGSDIVGEARWTATTKNLPISIWDDEGGFSSLHTLTLHFLQNLQGFEWGAQNIAGGETLYNVEPNDAAIPEPSALLLLMLGAVGLLRRRVA